MMSCGLTRPYSVGVQGSGIEGRPPNEIRTESVVSNVGRVVRIWDAASIPAAHASAYPTESRRLQRISILGTHLA
jgi:hypothetical protein